MPSTFDILDYLAAVDKVLVTPKLARLCKWLWILLLAPVLDILPKYPFDTISSAINSICFILTELSSSKLNNSVMTLFLADPNPKNFEVSSTLSHDT